MNVLSLFDGMSCGRIALERAGVEVSTYYASELDKYAIQVSQANWPENIQLGDVTKWREWDIDWSSIDLLIGGSPCQGFSFAGKQAGTSAILNGEKIIVTDREAYLDLKEKGAEFLSQSYLFWEYVLCLDRVRAHNKNAKFLLENVKMKKELIDMISGALGVKPVFINSALVSAQNRQRYYWSDLPIGEPDDKGILLKDILEANPDVKWFHTSKALDYMDRQVKGGRTHWNFGHHADTDDGKSPCITANMCKGVPYNMLIVRPASMVGRRINPLTGNREDYNTGIEQIQTLEVQDSEKSRCLSTVMKDTLLTPMEPGRHRDNLIYRKLTPIECERLQTASDNYTNHVSNSQRYKMLGNGWTIDVIAHIFKGLK